MIIFLIVNKYLPNAHAYVYEYVKMGEESMIRKPKKL